MSKFKGTSAPTSTVSIRGVEVLIKKVPFGKLQEFQDMGNKLKEGDDQSLEYVKQVILDYTDIKVEEDYNPFGATDDALTLDEIMVIFRAIVADGKKKEVGEL